MILPVITLYQPWAAWVARGWKPTETRTHDRFKSLLGKTILIHAGMKNDKSSAVLHNPYLSKEQLTEDRGDLINGAILCSAYVLECRWLKESDAENALIECKTPRFGLILAQDSIQPFPEPILVKGEMGIWYFDTHKKIKVKKPVIEPCLSQSQ